MSSTTDQEQNPPVNIEEVLQKAVDRRLESSRIAELSDPSRDQMRSFSVMWPGMPVAARRYVVQEMARQGDDNLALDFSRYFRAVLDDEDEEVRAVAVRALWENDSLSFLVAITELALTEESAAVQEAIAVTLASFSYQVALDELDEEPAARVQRALFHLLENGRNWMVRRRALESAAYMSRNQRVKDAIQYAYESDFEQESAGALVAMGQTLDNEWYPFVQRELTNEDPDIRCEAARAAGMFGKVDAIEQLANLSSDEDEEIREVSIRAIGQIGGKGAIDTLRYLETQVAEEMKSVVQDSIEEAEFMAESTLPEE